MNSITLEEVLGQLREGVPTKNIAQDFGISENALNQWIIEAIGVGLILNQEEIEVEEAPPALHPFPIFGMVALK